MLNFAKKQVKEAMIRRIMAKDRQRRELLAPEFDGLPPSLWDLYVDDDGMLSIQGQRLYDLATTYGTPLHIVNYERQRQNCQRFLKPFQARYPSVRLATSYKTNPIPSVLRLLHRCGTLAEVVSYFELWMALEIGVPPDEIIVNGPGKGNDCLDLCVERGVRLINLDSMAELDGLSAICRRRDRSQAVGIRLVTSVGWSAQFGFGLSSGAALKAAEAIVADDNLTLEGLHLHLGTGIKSADGYRQAVEEVLRFRSQLKQAFGVDILTVDLGGGFGVPTVRKIEDWDGRMMALGYAPRMAIPTDCPAPEDYAVALVPLFEEYGLASGANGPAEIIFEPGRAITSDAQVLLLTVVAIKEAADGQITAIVDGGKNVAMPLGWETHQMFVVNRMHEPHDRIYDLYGPLCHPGDFVALKKPLPTLSQGDVIAIADSGAYFVPNQMNFCNPRAAIVGVDGGEIIECRHRESFADIIRLDTEK